MIEVTTAFLLTLFLIVVELFFAYWAYKEITMSDGNTVMLGVAVFGFFATLLGILLLNDVVIIV